MPIWATRAVLASGVRSITTPSASSTSAAPHLEDAARLPCLTIFAPAAAATIVPIVEMLTACAPSPPEPTRSTMRPGIEIGAARSSITSARPPSSAGVSPFIRSAIPNPAIWAGVAAPSMISFMAHAVSSAARVSPLTSAPISDGHVVRASIGPARLRGSGRGARGALAHEAGQSARERRRIDRMAHHRVGHGPRGQPAVVGPADDQQRRGAVVDLVLGLAADAHAPGRLGLAVEHHDVRASRVQEPDQRGVRGYLDHLRL